MICSPSDHTVGRPLYRFEHGMGGLEAGTTLTTRPPHLLHNILRELNVPGIELSLRQNVGLYPIHTLINISILIISNFRLKITLRGTLVPSDGPRGLSGPIGPSIHVYISGPVGLEGSGLTTEDSGWAHYFHMNGEF